MFGMRHSGSHTKTATPQAATVRAPSPAWRRTPRPGGGFGGGRYDARRPHAGTGRPPPPGAGADRRAAAPRLRDHQGAGGQDRGLVRAEPRIVYPTLTYLEEASYVTAQTDGAKRLYTITGEGRAYLESNRAFVDAVLQRLDAVGDRMRRGAGEDDDTAADGRCRGWFAPPSKTCTRSPPDVSRTTPMRKPRSSKCSRGRLAN